MTGPQAMTQDKAPVWAREEIQRIYDRYEMSMSGTAFCELALSQAYERGQESMREKAADECARLLVFADTTSGADKHIAQAIRSLPIEQDSEDKK